MRKFLSTGNEQAFRQLYRRHAAALYALALRLVGGKEADAQDVLQETWIRACKTLNRFEWRSSLRTWLTGILINCARETSRELQRRKEEELSESFQPLAEARPAVVDLERSIARLPTGYRHVFTLHDIQGYTHEEIGSLLEITVGTSKSQLFYARRALRSELERSQAGNE
ncbi:MAG TPA: RNA polymerase sigma factor [Pyrinomonadaceae bacterium]|nr:RNA polymerase sigma factor [Pyrinomonadaceae bacterium]